MDLAQHFAGAATWVSGLTARRQHPQIEAEDTALALVRYESGAAGVIEATTSLYPGFSRRVEVHGERGSIVLDGNDISLWNLLHATRRRWSWSGCATKARQRRLNGASDPMALDVIGHQRQIEDFVAALREGRSPAVDGAEDCKALEIVLAVYQSADLGHPVELPLPKPTSQTSSRTSTG